MTSHPRLSDPGPQTAPDSNERPVLAMPSLGKLGRFGNQIMQYAFLRICARQSGAAVRCPPWVGQTIFGRDDPPLTAPLPPAIERWETGLSMFDLVPEFIPFIEKVSGATCVRIGPEALGLGLSQVDLWGHFQFHTRYYRPYRDYFRSLFRPVPELESALEPAVAALRAKGRTIVALHLRRGDFRELPHFGFTYLVPSKWWRAWLDGIWGRLRDPVLLICSDDLAEVGGEFKDYSPVTARDLPRASLPQSGDLEFFTDFHLLQQADILGISNSTFSFVAALLNQRAQLFVRPRWEFSSPLMEFDPWDSAPLLYYGGLPRVFKSVGGTFRVAYATGGVRGLLSCAPRLAREFVKMKRTRAYYGYQLNGLAGALRSIATGLRS